MEPEEESDEEWRLIAEEVAIFEQQFNHARTQANSVSNRATENVGIVAVAVQPTQQAQPSAPQVAPSVQRSNWGRDTAAGVSMGQPSDPMIIPPSTAPRPAARVLPVAPVHAAGRPSGRPPLSGGGLSRPPAGVARVTTVAAGEASQRLQGIQIGTGRDETASLKATITALNAENERLRNEYKSKIRHLEAVKEGQSGASTRVRLLEREVQQLRRGTVGVGTQGGDVVEGTQSGLEVLKASLRPVRREIEEGGDAGTGFGVWEMDKMFIKQLLTGLLVDGCGGVPVELARLLAGFQSGEWGFVVGYLEELLEGELWHVGVAGVRVVVRTAAGRRAIVSREAVVRQLLSRLKFDVGGIATVLEGVLMGCLESGENGDCIRRLIMMNDCLTRMFRNGEDVGRVVQVGVIIVLEAEEGRIGDDEWGTVEGYLSEFLKRREGWSALGVCAVLAGEVLIRNGGVEMLLNCLMDGVLKDDYDAVARALRLLKDLVHVSGNLKVGSSIGVVVAPFLGSLVEKHIDGALVVAHALYNTE